MSVRFPHFCTALAVFAAVHPAMAQVTNLGIALSGNQTILFWPTTFSNYTLQSTTNLATTNWLTVSNAVPVTAVAVTDTSSALFFRLHFTGQPGMALVPAGTFTMGDTLDGEYDAIPTVAVYVSAFYMDTNLVSYGQWQSVYNWATNNGYGFDNAGTGKASNQPVYSVSWDDTVKWCNGRSQQVGLIPVYYTDTNLTQVYKNGDVIPYVNWTANGFRLPTEAEWEKAARGGLIGQRFPWGDTISENQANYYGNTDLSYDLGPDGYNSAFDSGATPFTSPVGYFAANGYGLHDMAGNVLEWCWDWYGTPYGQPTTNNPTGPTSGSYRVCRGGFWNNYADFSRCANRVSGYSPSGSSLYSGFRSVCRF